MRAAISSRSRVVMPASASASSTRMVSATTWPASRMMTISRGDFRTIVLSAVGFRCIWPRLCIAECDRVPFLLGLTGNIACGKSTVGALLADRFAADYIDADRLVHALYDANTPETRAIAERFGTS